MYSHTSLAIRMAWSTDGSNTAPSTLHVPNTAPFSHRITQQPYAAVFHSVIRAKTDLRRSPSLLRVGLVPRRAPRTTSSGVRSPGASYSGVKRPGGDLLRGDYPYMCHDPLFPPSVHSTQQRSGCCYQTTACRGKSSHSS